MKRKNSKSEARNPKSETILNDQNSNVPNKRHIWHREYDSVFVIKTFDIRIWIFGFRILPMALTQIMPSGLRPKPGPLDPDFYFDAQTQD